MARVELVLLSYFLSSAALAAAAPPASLDALKRDGCEAADEACSVGLLQTGSGRLASQPLPVSAAHQPPARQPAPPAPEATLQTKLQGAPAAARRPVLSSGAAAASQVEAAKATLRVLSAGARVLNDMKAAVAVGRLKIPKTSPESAAMVANNYLKGADDRVKAALLVAGHEAKQHGLCEGTDLASLVFYFVELSQNASETFASSHHENGLTVLDVLNPSKTPPECLYALSIFGHMNRDALAVCAEKMWGLDTLTSGCVADFASSSAGACLPACAAVQVSDSASLEEVRRCAVCSNPMKPALVACIAKAAKVRPGCAECMKGFARGITKFCIRDAGLDTGCMVNEFMTFRMCTGDFIPRLDLPKDDLTPLRNYLPIANYEPFQEQ